MYMYNIVVIPCEFTSENIHKLKASEEDPTKYCTLCTDLHNLNVFVFYFVGFVCKNVRCLNIFKFV